MACRAPTTRRSSPTFSEASSATATTYLWHWRTSPGLRAAPSPASTPQRRTEVAAAFREAGGVQLAALVRVVLLCYYRDDRVMRSLGQEPRAPFPKGHVVEQGDWSLLDPVRKRPRMYRPVD